MKSTRKVALASAIVLSLLVIGMVPAASQTDQSTSTNSANTLIQLAEAAQSYAQQLLTIGQQQEVNVTGAQTLINEGSALLAQAQSEVNTNSTQAAKDALSSMDDFHSAAVELQSEVLVSISLADEVAWLQTAIQAGEYRTSQLTAVADKACSSPNASASVCANITSNLSQATTDLNNASSLLSSVNSSNARVIIPEVQSLLKQTMGDLQNVLSDLQTLASSQREQKAIDLVQNVLEPKLATIQSTAQKVNLTSSQMQQIQGLLSDAQTSLTGAIQSFQSGNFTGGLAQVNRAEKDMVTASHDIVDDSSANYVQNKLIPEVAALQNAAKDANLTSSELQTVQSQLSQALTDLNGAIQSFQSGSTASGMLQVQQALQLMQQAQQEIQGH